MGNGTSAGNSGRAATRESNWLKIFLAAIAAVASIATAVIMSHGGKAATNIFYIDKATGPGPVIGSGTGVSGSPSVGSPAPSPADSSSPQGSPSPDNSANSRPAGGSGWIYHYTITGLGSNPVDIDDDPQSDPDRTPDIAWNGTGVTAVNGAHVIGGLSAGGFTLQQCRDKNSTGNYFGAAGIVGASFPVHLCVSTSAGSLRQVIVKSQDSEGTLSIDVEWPQSQG